MSVKSLSHPSFHGAPVAQPVALPDPVSSLMPGLKPHHYAYFWAALVGGFAGLVLLSVAIIDTSSFRLADVFVVAGSLFVPILFVYYLDLRNMFVEPHGRTVVLTFLLGAFLALPLAFILEIFLGAGVGAPVPALITGLIEEFCKGLALFWVLRKRHHTLRFEMDGIILGAAAGMGFAALEDIEYGVASFGHGLHSVVAEVWVRQVLGPFGHGTWTAILGAAIWKAKKGGNFRLTGGVIGAYLFVAILHGVWDWTPLGLLTFLVVGVVGLVVLRTLIHQSLAEEKQAEIEAEGVAGPGGALPGAVAVSTLPGPAG